MLDNHLVGGLTAISAQPFQKKWIMAG